MRYLVISDLHSNWEALQAVLKEASGAYERIVCCGDVVGYGPDPNRIVDWTREHAHVLVRGNHDRACCGMENLEWFNAVAQVASRWTMQQLQPENYEWLRTLPRGPVIEGEFQVVHGSPLDEDEYVSNLSDAANVLPYVESNLTFFGHTHLQGGFSWVEGKRSPIARPEWIEKTAHVKLEPDGAYLVNPGSVGQPRDADPRAAYATYDDTSGEIILHRVEYDIDSVARRMVQAGLPPSLAARLSVGR